MVKSKNEIVLALLQMIVDVYKQKMLVESENVALRRRIRRLEEEAPKTPEQGTIFDDAEMRPTLQDLGDLRDTLQHEGGEVVEQ